MDKRFFLALFLSLIVIAISQLLFPPTRPKPASQTTIAKDSAARLANTTPAAATAQQADSSASAVQPSRTVSARPDIVHAVQAATVETTTVTVPKAVYRFSSVGAAPISAVIRDYQNRSSGTGQVDLGVPGSPLLAYRLITPSDTVDLSKLAFTLKRANTPAGEQTLAYSAAAGSVSVSIVYTIPADTAASY